MNTSEILKPNKYKQMKTKVLLIAISICYCCNKVPVEKVSFGIYNIIDKKDIPSQLNVSLNKLNITAEKDNKNPFIGYTSKDDSSFNSLYFNNNNIKILKSIFTVDNENKFNALTAIEIAPVISNSEIEKAKKTNSSTVEIHFNYKGATKWAEMTNKNIGKNIAFVINDRIYCLPIVNAEIKSGVALITGIAEDSTAKKIAASINASIK